MHLHSVGAPGDLAYLRPQPKWRHPLACKKHLQFGFGLDTKNLSISRSVHAMEPSDDREDAMMPVPTAIQKLAKLLADEARIEEKIRDTKSALSIVQKRVPESLAQHYISMKEPRIQIPEDLMRDEESFERVTLKLFFGQSTMPTLYRGFFPQSLLHLPAILLA